MSPIPYHFRQSVHRELLVRLLLLGWVVGLVSIRQYTVFAAAKVQFNRDVRRILSDNCFRCHGFDPQERKAKLRLDTFEGATHDLGGRRAVVPGNPDSSELIKRLVTQDPDDKMPPPKSGKKLTLSEIAVLKQWINEGASYSEHWSYLRPHRPPLPPIRSQSWVRNGIDSFVLDRLEKEGLKPSPEADPRDLARRVSLDLIGLAPSPEEVAIYISDRAPGAYERYVDRIIAKPSFGEHWARMWLDHARYADSSGYADDPARTIWAFRDYVIRSFNFNKPFDLFTIEQLAGDLISNPSEEHLIATAFHRNTMTNNEGGTNDEEFRTVAVVDRVNTTFAVWMGTTMACAQCHDHKYDPLSQEDYFRFYALLNNTEDADRTDESPILPIFTEEQKQARANWEKEIERIETIIKTPTPALAKEQQEWEQKLVQPLSWKTLRPAEVSTESGSASKILENTTVSVPGATKPDEYRVALPITESMSATGLRILAMPILLEQGVPATSRPRVTNQFSVNRIEASILPLGGSIPKARSVRIEIPGKDKILSLAEVMVMVTGTNRATFGEARQSSTGFGGPAKLAIDGNTDGRFNEAKSTTHTEISSNPWWEVDLKADVAIEKVVIWNRTDPGTESRLSDFVISLLDEKRTTVWKTQHKSYPNPSLNIVPDGRKPVVLAGGFSEESTRPIWDAKAILDAKDDGDWVGSYATGKDPSLILFFDKVVEMRPGSILELRVRIRPTAERPGLGRFEVAASSDSNLLDFQSIPSDIAGIVRKGHEQRSSQEQASVNQFFPQVATSLAKEREALAKTKKQLSESKPFTTVPIARQLARDKQRKTMIQKRGNFLDLGNEVQEGLPKVFGGDEVAAKNRMDLAKWLINGKNPLTPRVVVNHFWESLFGVGIVRTSEEFGVQGEPPSHPELLDWMATELVASGWDVKRLIRMMVTSTAYRQSSKVTPELLAKDPENRLLARGPRFRLSAETIRDQALQLAGLLSSKMYGPPVKPLQPKQGLSAAFGSGIDWETSAGEDSYRRGLYTTWRRSNPYPSMATFDAPNREVCMVRRERSNTPLQALVTLNDPVYVEAAQGLALRLMCEVSGVDQRIRHGFEICTSRLPDNREFKSLRSLFYEALQQFEKHPEQSKSLWGTIKSIPGGNSFAEAASWTVLGNVLLNLDEVLMKR